MEFQLRQDGRRAIMSDLTKVTMITTKSGDGLRRVAEFLLTSKELAAMEILVFCESTFPWMVKMRILSRSPGANGSENLTNKRRVGSVIQNCSETRRA
jgi:hypothetical protein